MKLKLQCRLVVKEENPVDDNDFIAEDINIIELPDNLPDVEVQQFFQNLRTNMKKKYFEQIEKYFDVTIKDIG